MNYSLTQLTTKICIAAMLLFSLAACGGKARPFVPLNEGMTFKPARLAIICGETDDIGKNFVAALTEEMQARTTFKVLSQQEIAQKIKGYPFTIKVVKKAADPQKPVWLAPAETKRITALQAKLKVDYIFVVWGMNLGHEMQYNHSPYGGGNTDYYYMSVFGNMFEYPKGNVVTFTDFSNTKNVHMWEVLLFKKQNYHIEALIKDSSKYLVDNIIKVTKFGKKS